MEISRRGSAAGERPQQSVGRTADATPTAYRMWMQLIVPLQLPPRFSSLPRAKNTDALSGRVPAKRALLSSAPTNVAGSGRCIIVTPGASHHLRGRSMSPPLRGCQAFCERRTGRETSVDCNHKSAPATLWLTCICRDRGRLGGDSWMPVQQVLWLCKIKRS